MRQHILRYKQMNLEEAKEYTKHQMMINGHKSDGCTLVKDFVFTPACQVHDMLIRFNKVSRKEADKLYLEYMLELAGDSLALKIVAYIYYYAMRYVAILFNGDFTLALGLHGFTLIVVLLYYFG